MNFMGPCVLNDLKVFDTVLAATGRKADVQPLGLETVGVALSDNGKVSICIVLP